MGCASNDYKKKEPRVEKKNAVSQKSITWISYAHLHFILKTFDMLHCQVQHVSIAGLLQQLRKKKNSSTSSVFKMKVLRQIKWCMATSDKLNSKFKKLNIN